ncbi:transient receptor potential cation channel subfamily M member 3 [Trichonephila clavipes]|nr:transient receptor potential cation channel subfamily M member 3 [Trichonephila clavipes]
MWILTNGINVGVTKIIGDAIHEEINRRNSKSHFQKTHHMDSDHNSKIVVIGVAREDLLNHGDSFDGSREALKLCPGEEIENIRERVTSEVVWLEIENEGNKIEEQKFDLNPDHTHFLIVKDGTINKTGINYFLLRLQHYLASSLDQPRNSASNYRKYLPWSFFTLNGNTIVRCEMLIGISFVGILHCDQYLVFDLGRRRIKVSVHCYRK